MTVLHRVSWLFRILGVGLRIWTFLPPSHLFITREAHVEMYHHPRLQHCSGLVAL